ncbi:MAG TPA: hypothetical protein VFM34_04355 [Moraxellaceae bacterium]|nr:hypothetical protein [Moraxellaceae bacterium]
MSPFRLAALLCVPAILGGCASTSVFSPYPGQAAQYRAALDAGSPDAAIAHIGHKTTSADATLYLMEKGRVAQLAHQTDVSRDAFDQAITRLQAQDDRATISASRYAASGASLLTNDNARPYDGRTYERVFVHQYQALNYLASGDEQGALVEVRRANQVQVDALHAKENQVDSARQEAESKGFDANRYNGYFSSMDVAAGRVKSGFQNAATFYLSGLIYEATGAVNDAFIDYRKALELVPDNPYLQRDVVRTGQKTGLDEIRTLARALGPVQIAPHKDEGELVVYLEEGYVPSKVPVSIPIWTSKTVNNVSFPVYKDATPPHLLTVQVDGQSLPAALLVDTRALAVRSLKDEVPAMLARSFIRLLTRQTVQRQAREADSTGLFGLFTTVYSLVAEQPDLRSWLTLPGSGQVVRIPLTAGVHQMSLPGMTPQDVAIKAGRPTLVHLVVVPGKTYSQTYAL